MSLARRRGVGFHRAMNELASELCESGTLQRLLEQHAAAVRAGRVAAAFACGSAVVTASVGGEGSRPAPIGCVAKLLTATLVASAAERGYLGRDAGAAELLGIGVEALRGVTVRHLLEHTHGLDDSLLAKPRQRNGFVDRGELSARLAALTRWARPGAAYSYGNSGAWLLAAALERLHGRAFGALVRELLAPLGVEGARCAAAPCAATGAGLVLTAEELVRFASHALRRDRAVAAGPITPLPGWHPLERGVCLGWKSAGAGWFGHQSAWPGASSYVRAHAQRKLALAVVAREQAAASLIALGVFGRHLTELFERRTRVPAEAGSPLPDGVYAQAARVVAVTSTPRGRTAEAWARDEHGARRGEAVRARLVPAGGLFLARPASELVPFLEAVRGPTGADWLWNGRFVLRRVA